MTGTPRISIVMAFFNCGAFIQEAIQSVFAQDYTDWELLLVDDGSSDASTRIAIDYARQDPARVRYFQHANHQNRGTGVSRNLGVVHARAALIAFLDGDDVWLPSKLAQQLDILDTHPEAAMVYGPALIWHSWTGKPDDLARDFVPNKDGGFRNTVVSPPKLLPLLLRDECVEPFLSGVLVRRTAIGALGGFHSIHRPMFNDTVLYAKLFAEFPIFVADRCWYKYRRHPASLTAVAEETGQYHSSLKSFLEWLAQYLWTRRVTDETVWAILRRELGPYGHPRVYQLSRLAKRLAARGRKLAKRTAMRMLPRVVPGHRL